MNVDDPQDIPTQPYDPLLDDPDPRAYDDEVPPPPGDVVEWMVQDEEHAAQLVDAIHQKRERYVRVKASCDAMVKQALADMQSIESAYSEQLKRWAAAQLEGKTRRSILLPTGKLAFRKVQAACIVRDQAVTLAWAAEHLPEAVAQDPRLRNGVVSAHALKTGEIPPGTVLIDEHESFKVGSAS